MLATAIPTVPPILSKSTTVPVGEDNYNFIKHDTPSMGTSSNEKLKAGTVIFILVFSEYLKPTVYSV